MTLEATLNLLAWLALFGVGIVPLFIALRVKLLSLRILSLLLGAFALTHGLYHLSEAYSLDFLSDVVLEPVSVVFLVSFGLYYSKKGMF